MSGPSEDYLYVFGRDAQGTPYFGVVQLRLGMPFDASAAAAALSAMEVRDTGDDRSTIFSFYNTVPEPHSIAVVQFHVYTGA